MCIHFEVNLQRVRARVKLIICLHVKLIHLYSLLDNIQIEDV